MRFSDFLFSQRIAAAEIVARFPAHAQDVNVLVFLDVNKLGCGFQDVGVECSCQAFFARHDDQQRRLLFTTNQQRMQRLAGLGIIDIGARHQRLQNIGQHLRVWTRRQRTFLRAAQLGR